MGSVKMGNNFILEPGELKLRMIASSSSVITGGYYNDAVFNSWRLSDEYKAAQANYQQLKLSEHPEAEQARRRHVDAIGEAHEEMLQLEMQGMANVALTHPDPLVRRLTIESTWLFGPWVNEALRGLAETDTGGSMGSKTPRCGGGQPGELGKEQAVGSWRERPGLYGRDT